MHYEKISRVIVPTWIISIAFIILSIICTFKVLFITPPIISSTDVRNFTYLIIIKKGVILKRGSDEKVK